MMTISIDSILFPYAYANAGRKLFRNREEVKDFNSQARTLESVLIRTNSQTKIDFLSINIQSAEL